MLRVLLEAAMLEKAFAELRDELQRRPDWAWIPMHSILHLMGLDFRELAARLLLPSGEGTEACSVGPIREDRDSNHSDEPFPRLARRFRHRTGRDSVGNTL